MVEILAGVGIVALLVATFYFVLWMEEWDEKRKQKRLEEFYRDEDDDDSSGDSALFPLKNFMGMHPTGAAAITLFFLPQIRNNGDGQADDFTNNDSVVLAITEGTAFEVMRDLVAAFNGGPHSDGFLVVADDMATLLDNTTRDAVYLVNNITAVTTITDGAAFS